MEEEEKEMEGQLQQAMWQEQQQKEQEQRQVRYLMVVDIVPYPAVSMRVVFMTAAETVGRSKEAKRGTK